MVSMRTDFGVIAVDYVPEMSVAQAVQATLDKAQLELFGASWQVQETQTGRVLYGEEKVVNGRYYYLTAFLRRRPKFRRGE